jgi:hypothetical protein
VVSTPPLLLLSSGRVRGGVSEFYPVRQRHPVKCPDLGMLSDIPYIPIMVSTEEIPEE